MPRCLEYAKPHYNLTAWKNILLELGMEGLEHLNHFSKIEQHLGRAPISPEEFKQYIPLALYRKYDENPNLAKLAAFYECEESAFNLALALKSSSTAMHYPKYTPLPDITLNMAEELDKFISAKAKQKENSKKEDSKEDPEEGAAEERPDMHSDREISAKEIETLRSGLFFIKLPENDPRHILFSLKYHNVLSPNQSIYLIIKAADNSNFDPYNIDWENLENDGHSVVRSYRIYSGANDQLFMDNRNHSSITLPHESRRCDKIIAHKFLELFPNLEVILDIFYTVLDNIVYSTLGNDRISSELEGLEGWALDITNHKYQSKSLDPFGILERPFHKQAQIDKIDSLDAEYLESLFKMDDFINPTILLSPCTIDAFDTPQEIMQAHAEIIELRKQNIQKYETLKKCLHNFETGMQLGYKILRTLPDETLEFLASLGEVAPYVNLREIAARSKNHIDFKRYFMKSFFAPMLDNNEDIISKFDHMSDDAINSLATSELLNNPMVIMLNIFELASLEPSIIKALTSKFASELYPNGVSYKELLAPDALSVKQNIVSAVIRLKLDQENYVYGMSSNIASNVKSCSERHLDYMIFKLIDRWELNAIQLIQLLDFMAKNPDASEERIKTRDLEILYSEKNKESITEGAFSNLDEEKLEILLNHRYGYDSPDPYPMELLVLLNYQLMKKIMYCKGFFSAYKASPETLLSLKHQDEVVEAMETYEQRGKTLQEIDDSIDARLKSAPAPINAVVNEILVPENSHEEHNAEEQHQQQFITPVAIVGQAMEEAREDITDTAIQSIAGLFV